MGTLWGGYIFIRFWIWFSLFISEIQTVWILLSKIIKTCSYVSFLWNY